MWVNVSKQRKKAMKYEILSHVVVAREPGKYLAWPSVAKMPLGELIVAFSGDRDAHVCPFGKTQIVRSSDGGKTWGAPETVNDTPVDDRDAGLSCTRGGRLIVTWFTLDYSAGEYYKALSPEKLALYKPKYDTVTAEDRLMWTNPGIVRQQWLRGHFLRTSDDAGRTWGPAVRTTGSAPHGVIERSNGVLGYLGNQSYNDVGRADLLTYEESKDGGKSWWLVGRVPMFTEATDCTVSYLCEPHVVEAGDGSLVGVYRHEIKGGKDLDATQRENVLYFNRSTDGGVTWTKPKPSGLIGKPAHIMKLSDGRLMVSYGHRFKPYGQRVAFSSDNGETWPVEDVIAIREDAPNGDLGYPASVELADGTILTVYYQPQAAGEKTSILGTFWRLK
jgi:sialidase-1